ncbi:MAG: TetR/AcrR family transcriptional regulator [Pseudomonadota bacterium]
MWQNKSDFIAKSKKGYQTRMSLLGAAFDIIADDGLKTLSVSAICTRVGLQRSSFYTHFQNLEALLDALVNQVLDDVGYRAQTAFEESGQILSLFEFRIKFLLNLAINEPNYASVLHELYTFFPPTISPVKARVLGDINLAQMKGQIHLSQEEADAFAHIIVASVIDALKRLTTGEIQQSSIDPILELLFSIIRD